jgi:hypothetical protein
VHRWAENERPLADKRRQVRVYTSSIDVSGPRPAITITIRIARAATPSLLAASAESFGPVHLHQVRTSSLKAKRGGEGVSAEDAPEIRPQLNLPTLELDKISGHFDD